MRREGISGFFFILTMYLGMNNYVIPSVVSLGLAGLTLKIRKPKGLSIGKPR